MIFDMFLKLGSCRYTLLAYLTRIVHSQRMSFLMILQGMKRRKNFIALKTRIRVRLMERFMFFQSFSGHKTIHTFATLIGCLAGNSMVLQCLTADKYFRAHFTFEHNALFVYDGMFFKFPLRNEFFSTVNAGVFRYAIVMQ